MKILSPRPALTSLLLACGLALGATTVGCVDPTPNGIPPEGATPADDDAGQGAEPPPGTVNTALPVMVPATCSYREQIVKACNYLHSYEVNSALSTDQKEAAGVTSDFDPTEECVEILAGSLPLDSTWEGETKKKERTAILRALHTLLFHPLRVPKDNHLAWPNAPGWKSPAPRFTNTFVADTGAPQPEDGNDVALTKTWNQDIFYLIRNKVPRIQLANLTGDSANMSTDKGGNIYVNINWLTTPTPTQLPALQMNKAYKKYVVARTLFHEVRHAIHDTPHVGCTNAFGNEAQCDPTVASAYGYGFQMGQAMMLGGLWTRLPNQDGPMLTGVAADQAAENCFYGLHHIDDVGEWAKENGQGGTCNKGASSIYNAEKAKLPTNAAGPRPPDPVTGEWVCEGE